MKDTTKSKLDSAPDEVKLAVDLIYLFEKNNISSSTALKAIEIIKSDLELKLINESKVAEPNVTCTNSDSI